MALNSCTEVLDSLIAVFPLCYTPFALTFFVFFVACQSLLALKILVHMVLSGWDAIHAFPPLSALPSPHCHVTQQNPSPLPDKKFNVFFLKLFP